ncbi:CPBP family intramembrane glutamic endopeptidase [Afifella pfennigii]|uniref:CPBP family intramembrane glutamic endopeptidase n=1 Tax=Afifella pfennigii TaxID=209897 RepID=UPI00146FC4D4|nr:CPBP family intramembrane glutamic endopeptidase [Afifella pfennigii]
MRPASRAPASDKAAEIAPPPGPARRARLTAEAALLYLGGPLAIHYGVVVWNLRVFVLLAAALPVLALILWLDGSFDRRHAFHIGGTGRHFRRVLLTFLLAAPLIALFTYGLFPGRFLSLPRFRPELWLLILAFYPFVSAAPQELLYRVLFFHRYRTLFGGHRAVAILANAGLFGFAHIIFGSAVSVAGSFALGLLLAWRYETSRSFWPVWLEHAFYGALAFTIGLGGFFYLSAGG